jgi:alkanesulfonate monooxygenase SsuD/methylene tetrahydromethanopterin reductase-like flavin-dependent oxidoreductase (luciferase family)
MSVRLGVRIHREQPPESVLSYAQAVESLGFDEAWIVEDLAFGGGLTAAAAVLAATERITAGTGILAAVVRNPAYLAMEIATLERMFPGRIVVGIGHGVQSWMSEVGARAASPITALGETLSSVEALLQGRRVTVEGRYVRLDDVALTFPPPDPPPLLAGVRGPKSLAIAGATCDGVLLAEPASPAYLGWARAQVEAAATQAHRPEPQIAVYTWCCVDGDSQTARQRLLPVLEENLRDPGARVHLHGLPFADELSARLDDPVRQGPGGHVLEPGWMDQLAVVGTADECAAALQRLADAGAGRIILLPLPGDEQAQIQAFAQDVRPRLP